ncbi:MAG: hypothetical protein AAGC74_05795 [Verrucomicrobiota bacterium]
MASVADNLLRKRTYFPVIARGNVPKFRDVLPEWLDTHNIFKHREAQTTVIWTSHHLLCLAFTVLFFTTSFSWINLLWWLGFALFHAHFFHTFWYHRFASHKAFKFRHKFFSGIIYWLNPLLIKEEAYAIPHFVHHKLSDKPGDPYGPINGFWGSFSATESANFLNRSMTEKQFKFCTKYLSHLPTKFNDQETFQKTGSLEQTWRYPVRFLVTNGFWIGFFLLLGRPDLLAAWYFGAIFFLLIMRDFNYRGHDEHHPEHKFDDQSWAVNQWVYGWLASEWHDNHHRFSASAKCGFKKGEFDASFFFTRLLHKIGILQSYVDSSNGYAREAARIEASKKSSPPPETGQPPAEGLSSSS